MNTIIIALLLTHLISIMVMELVIYSLPFEYHEDWKRALIIGTPVNILFNVFVFFRTMTTFFSGGLILTIRNLLTLNCSYQDIARLSASCIVSIVISLIVSGLVFLFVKKRYDTTEKFRFVAPLLLLCLIAVVPVMIGYQISRTGVNYISIDEVCRKTTTSSILDEQTIEDDDSSFVVIRNDGELAFDADKLFLSDNEEDLLYIQMNGSRVHPGDTYKCVMSGDDGMNIKKKGGTIVYLSNVEGKILDSVVVPALARDESYKKNVDGWEIVSWAEETSEPTEVAEPVFSADSGFYEDDFYLSLSAEDGATIYYTLDCTDPTVESICYKRPIRVYDKSSEPNKYRSIQNVQPDYKNLEEIGTEPVDKAFVVRAMAVDNDGNQSKTVTKTFWVDLEKYKKRTVVSLVTDPDNLFDAQTGIYVTGQDYDEWYSQSLKERSTPGEGDETESNVPILNYMQRGEEWEREANCEIFGDSAVILNQPVGIRVQGNNSRKYALKRFSVYSRKEYSGSKWFDAPILSDKLVHSFVLREGLRNAFVVNLVEDRDVAIQHGKAVDVFLDGEYWYSVYLLEKYSNSYFHEYYQLNSDNVLIVKNQTDPELLTMVEAEYESDEEAYSRINSVMDIQSYIDFMCINVYVDNEDMNEKWNCTTWKTFVKEDDEYGDTRWRWLLYDMDLGWNMSSKHVTKEIPYQINTFRLGVSSEYPDGKYFTLINQPLFKALRKNSVFCRNFVLSFMDLVNTDFRPENVLPKLKEWRNTSRNTTYFFTYRADYIVPYMAKEFELTGTQETVTLTSNRFGKPIVLNTIQPVIRGEWSGKYYTDYPVTVSIDDEEFDHWEITSNGITKTYYDTELEVPVVKGGVKINAIF